MNLTEKMSNKFSMHQQLVKLIEELGECSAAVARCLNPGPDQDIESMIDEIIDVEFLFAQMRYYFDGFEEAKDRNDAEVKARFFK